MAALLIGEELARDNAACASTEMLDLVGFDRWVAQAEPGERLVYHTGYLAVDCDPGHAGLSAEQSAALSALRSHVWEAAEDGLVLLVQQRKGPHCFVYLAIRSSRKAGGRDGR